MEIVVLGRRGPVQAAFTNPELRELGEMATPTSTSTRRSSSSTSSSRSYLESEADITARKNVEILNEFARKEPEGKPRRIVLRFLASPIEIQGDGRVERVVVGRNELHRDETGRSGPATPGSARQSRRGSSCARSATRACRSTASCSTIAAA